MVNHQASENSLDKQILLIFEDQEEKFSFPLTTQKQARDFVRLLNRQGFDYDMLSEEIGEKSEVFRGWRLGSGPDTIGGRILMRINKPIQEAMSCDVGTEEEMILCSGLVEESKAGSRIAGKHKEGRNTIIEEVSNVTSGTACKSEDNPIKAGKDIDTYPKIHKDSNQEDSNQEQASRKDGANDKVKSGVEVEIVSRDLKKSLEKSSPVLISSRDREIVTAKNTGQFVDHLEIMKESPSESSKIEEHNSRRHLRTVEESPSGSSEIDEHNYRKHLNKMEALEKQSKTLETTPIAIKTVLYARGPSSERKQNQDDKCEGSKNNNKDKRLKRSMETGKDISDSQSRENSDPERNRSKAMVEHKLQIENSETCKDSELNYQVRQLLLVDDDTNNDEIRDKNHNQFQITNSECQRSTSSASSLAYKHASSEMAIDSLSLFSPPKSSQKKDKSQNMTKVENSDKQFHASSKMAQQNSSAQNGSILILEENLSDKESCGIREQLTSTEIDFAIADLTREVPNLNRSSLLDSRAKESGSLTVAPSSIASLGLPQTTLKFPSIPVTTETISHTSDTTKDENIDENYNSDLDLENTDHSTEERTLIEKLRLLKSDEKQNGPGYLFVFSDTPTATGTGKHRIRIGVSRFPDKKFKQALLFNPDIRMVTTVAVEKRKTALYIAQDQLKSMSLRGKQGWYWGSIDVVMATITRII